MKFKKLNLGFTVEDSLPVVTIIVPTRPGQLEILSVTASRALNYPSDKLEIIVARGRQPAVQRNVAINAARGELIYFLDDDCIPSPGNLRRAVGYFQQSDVKMVSGPSLCPPDAPLLEQVFKGVHTSWLAFGPSRVRYAPVGEVRESDEKELIGCNLLARRDMLLELGGFHEALYPNEDHPLYIELKRRGAKMIYDPAFSVQRRPRPTLKAFLKMLVNYGRGRAEEFRLHPTFGAAPNFIPPLFCLYLVVAPWFGWRGLAPLVLYALAVLGQTAVSIFTHGIFKSLLAMPLIVITHLFYGLGFWRGLFTQLRGKASKPPTEVVLERFAI